MTPILGSEIAEGLRRDLVARVGRLAAAGHVPGLAAVLVGEDPASAIYVQRKVKQCQEVGMRSFEHRLAADCSQETLLDLIARLNADVAVDGILVQLPLPAHIDSKKVLETVLPAKDVDGFSISNAGRLLTGAGGMVPCTPLGCILLLETVVDDFAGMNAVVIGRSNIVGKPVALMLLERGCTVTVAHSRTRDLPEIVRRADIVIAAVGRPALVRGDWIKPGAVVIDVGINRVPSQDGKTRLVGDVAYNEMGHAKAVTPVPGGVGPMTIACLLSNTLKAAEALFNA